MTTETATIDRAKSITESMKMRTPSSIYLMHKYWGKKPADELNLLIREYSKEGDLLLDPFAWYGWFWVEWTLLWRNVIVNDLNPSANFIAKNILERDIDLEIVYKYYQNIRDKYQKMQHEWYFIWNYEIYIILRDNNDIPQKLRMKDTSTNKMVDKILSKAEKKEFLEKENNYNIKYRFPNNYLISNSRLSAKKEMKISDLFPKRSLISHSFLWNCIIELPDSNEKELLKFAFTSNVANCSKLVPPILSRWDMSQWAWMTWFYIWETYLENNVYHYFENRVLKIIKWKIDYLELTKKSKVWTYKIMSDDAKKMPLNNESIDFIFTDFPYWDTVPYFEQSQIRNSWLWFNVDYENEIVISNSNERKKNCKSFFDDIFLSIQEIYRLLKNDSYFVFTFHSMNGVEWEAISNSLVKVWFEFVDCKLMVQKTFTPRQLNRKKTVKWDVLAIYKKSKKHDPNTQNFDINDLITQLKLLHKNKTFDTNSLILICIKILLKSWKMINGIDFMSIIETYFTMDLNNNWVLKNDI